MSELVY